MWPGFGNSFFDIGLIGIAQTKVSIAAKIIDQNRLYSNAPINFSFVKPPNNSRQARDILII